MARRWIPVILAAFAVTLIPPQVAAAVEWASRLGGSAGESGGTILRVDGDVVLAGSTTSDDVPVTANAADPDYDPGGTVGRDGFVSRLSSDGTTLVYSTYLGGSGDDLAVGLVVLPDGDLVVLGQADSADLPGAASGAFPSNAGGIDVFLTRIDAATGAILWTSYFGGTGQDFPRDLVLTSGGEILVVGDTRSTDLPTGVAGDDTLDGPSDMFLARFAADGSFAGARYLGGTADDSAAGLVATDGETWIVGSTTSTDFPGAASNPAGDYDAVLVRVTADLEGVVDATYLGGTGDDRGRDLALAPDGATVVVYGTTTSTDFPTGPGAIATAPRQRDLFVTKFSTVDLARGPSTLFGTSGTDDAYGVALDPSGAVMLTASGIQGGLPTTPGAADLEGFALCNPYCFSDAIVARLNATLTTVQYATYLASSNGDRATDLEGSVIVQVGGSTGGPDFPTTPGVFGEQPNLGTGTAASDAWTAKLDLRSSVPQLAVTADAVSWSPLAGAESYDLVRGDLVVLRDSGDWTLSTDLCLAESTVGTSVGDAAAPGSGGVWWYLARTERPGTPTSHDAVSTAQRGTRDDGLADAPAACH